MAYVVVQHLDPRHESLLPDLLAQATGMAVHEARAGMVVAVNQVYVIAPNTNLTLSQGVLQLAPRTETGGQHLSIDTFLRSLAESRAAGALGVILSGMAADGTLGLQAIKAAGGMTFAQDPTTAQFDSMPQSAIAAGCVDFIGSSEAIAGELSRISRHAYVHQPLVAETEEEAVLPGHAVPTREPAFQQILRLLLRRTGTDFTVYKSATLERRIGRRMALLQIDHLAQYLTYLSDHQVEVEALYQDVLIGVTSFFRDPSTFQTLVQEILPSLLATKAADSPLRVWVAGCSTGEEVYSLAMCLLEALDERALPTASIQLFGTDLNARAIESARAGLYPEASVSMLSPARLDHFFRPVNGRYQIHKTVRDLCVFAQHNLLKDPPFSRIDLLSCQNVLIYLGLAAQKKVIQTFHYALAPYGVLLLGPSETIGTAVDLFAPVGEHKRQWSKKKASLGAPLLAGSIPRAQRGRAAEPGKEEYPMVSEEERNRTFDLQTEADHLLARFAPASVIIDAQMEILHFRGNTAPYLGPVPGRASLNLFKMARAGLDLELRTALSKARKTGQPVKKAGIHIREHDALRDITVEVLPLNASATERYFVILFAETNALPPEAAALRALERGTRRGAKDRRIQELEQELEAIREEMRRIIEESEAANEELHSANEESLSSNEELQSLNEELETSKEEIQASNEELLVLNAELQQRNTQVQESRDFADAIVETIREPLLVLDADLRVQRANQAFYQHFQVTPADTERRRIFELGEGQWNIPALRTLLEKLLPANHSFVDYEVAHTFPTIGYKIMLLNAQRIDHVELILLAMEDITERKQMEEALQERTERLRFMAESMPQKIFTARPNGNVDYFNPQWMEFTGLSFEEIKDWGWMQFIHPEDVEETTQRWQHALASGEPWYLEHRFRRADGVYRWHLSRAIPMRDAQGHIIMWIGSNTDITEQKDLERQKEAFLNMTTHELKTPLTAIQGNLQLAQRDLLRGQHLFDPEQGDQQKLFDHLSMLLSRTHGQLRVQTRLINDLLDVSRLQEHHLEVFLAPCNLISLVHETVQEAQTVYQERRITLDLPEQKILLVHADRDRIGQVIHNYLSNALKYSSPEKPARVGLTCESTTACVWVADQGPGLSEEMQHHIWEQFYRVPGIQVQSGQGVNLGVGLTICQGLIHRHQGQVGVESVLGEGSRFWFTLPLLQEGA